MSVSPETIREVKRAERASRLGVNVWDLPLDDDTDDTRCECGRAVPCRHCPTPIDPADIRPGDVVEFRKRVNVARVDSDGWIFASNGMGFTHGGDSDTWHLVSRPDPDAEAVEVLAEFLHEDSGCVDVWPCQSGAPYHRNRARAALDLVRRAES